VWQLRGKYPNRNYPKLFNDPDVGAEAKKVFQEGQALLQRIIDEKLLHASGVLGFFPANSVGDDIVVYTDESRTTVKTTFFGLRQQVEKDSQDQTYLCISDFIAPASSGVKDYIGMFAVASGFGCDQLAAKFEAAHDDYNSIMTKALADRLAEAFAEVLHEEIRKTYWGYAKDENLNATSLHKIQYQGIRPAFGYPSQPDHTEKPTMWDLLNVKEATGISLTESFAMMPAASVSALVFAHPESKYFAVGKIANIKWKTIQPERRLLLLSYSRLCQFMRKSENILNPQSYLFCSIKQ